METFTDLTDVVQNSFLAFGEKLMSVLPNILGAILLLIIGWLVAKSVELVVRKLLQSIKFDKLAEKFVDATSVDSRVIAIAPSKVVSKFIYWIILLLFFISASDTLGWNAVSGAIGELVLYLPELFSAIVVFILGLLLAGFVRKILTTTLGSLGMSAGSVLSNIIYYFILIIVATTALDQAGLDTSVITSKLTVILGGILLAFAISFGYSSRDVLTNILSSFYVRNSFTEGQHITIGEFTGVIKKIDSIHVTLSTEDGEILFPTHKLISENIIRT
ncbi:mechanosensitive ion channel family protein [Rhodohalobacter sp. 8-1]|uniref:mechanosensitive ion channel family protein n=1 Tax=Rhodohalobacter sp. 8-1 TaxID=3131972 RepID=UPI0030EB7CD6